ncbi:hypothetical protein JCM16303_000876 [Sporobolomyces ruberrimus]
MQTPSPPVPLANPRASSSNVTPTPSTSSSTSFLLPVPSSSYTASLPTTYRRSSFPVSPAIHLTTTNGSGTSTTTTLPPGLSFERRGCQDDDDYERATGSKAPFYPNYSTMRSQSVESSRNNSVSSSDEPTVRAQGGVGAGLGWLGNSGRSWSVNSVTSSSSMSVTTSDEKKKREAIKGWEDPALAAARRALWDDGETTDESGTKGTHGKDEISLLRDKMKKSGREQQDEEAIEFDEDEDNGEGESDEAQSGEEDEGEWDSNARALLRPPCHSTLSPGPSCLRSSSRGSHSPSPRFSSLSLSQDSPSLSSASLPPSSSSLSIDRRASSPSPSSSHSNSSSSNCSTSLTTTPSIRFSLDPPKTLPTHSKIDYERKGDLPVEKLSIREWIELQGVREAVGVWSGKIAKWDENETNPPTTTKEDHHLTSLNPNGASSSTMTTPTGSTISNSSSNGGRPSQLSLAALTGVVTVSKSTPSSPTSATSSPRLGGTHSLPYPTST